MSRATILFAALLLSACAQTSEFQRPALPVPNAWPGQTGAEGQQAAAQIHWHTFFTDPQLQALIQTTLENNRDLRIAAARIVEARAQYGIVRADQLPTVNFLGTSNTTHTATDFVGDGVKASSQRFDMSLSTVSYELDFWGRLADLSEAGRRSYLATEEAQRAVQVSLIADVATSYFMLLHTKELTELTRMTLDLREQSLDLVAKGKMVGGTDDYVFQQAQGVVETTRATLAEIEHQHTVAENRLNFLVGKVTEVPPGGRSIQEQGLDTELVAGLPSEVLLLRPDVISAEQRLLAAHANIDAARAAFLPKVTLTASLGLASQGLAGLFSGGGAWVFQPLLSLPIFDGGRTAANLDIARARKVIAVAEYEKTIQQAFREVADLLSARASLSRQLRASTANVGAQTKRLQIAQARFSAGVVSYLEVLDAQRDIVAAQQATAQVRRLQLESATQLYKALGGGAAA
ncbi:efflux transporter outer membrane subunit [Rhodoferax sp.]|uniref:efflux transporter outer membrane subunit n=1 Tax=Rhodoferax sp. TaxID=50421 RepID=UPI00374D5B0B